ncbi:submaxillary gland androgen-regulated protein 3A-like [Thunnus maccoyii]|uniref:submaxillary gland androgen-regulated protein 3A-like n=1 Tax=Thunnus maccoyii TaxID=8240 RepID=UPI001C4DBC0F|nr:submaxillary gland androgen-regulated protein 3A-like [Thunnus maccoyii]
MKFALLIIFLLINSPVANCHHYHSSDSDSHERGNRYPGIRLWPWFPFCRIFPGLCRRPPPAPTTPPPPPPTVPPTPKPTPTPGRTPTPGKTTKTTENPRGDNG